MTTFHVTADHLGRGSPHSQRLCPAVLCVSEQFPMGANVHSDGTSIFIHGEAYAMPAALVDWQKTFDGPARDKAGPISFDLPV